MYKNVFLNATIFLIHFFGERGRERGGRGEEGEREGGRRERERERERERFNLYNNFILRG